MLRPASLQGRDAESSRLVSVPSSLGKLIFQLSWLSVSCPTWCLLTGLFAAKQQSDLVPTNMRSTSLSVTRIICTGVEVHTALKIHSKHRNVGCLNHRWPFTGVDSYVTLSDQRIKAQLLYQKSQLTAMLAMCGAVTSMLWNVVCWMCLPYHELVSQEIVRPRSTQASLYPCSNVAVISRQIQAYAKEAYIHTTPRLSCAEQASPWPPRKLS